MVMRAISVKQQAAVEPQVFVQAAEDGDVVSVQHLLDAGADVNAVGAFGKTALIAAAAQGHTEIVRLLLRHGANVNAQKSDGFNALISAVFFGHEAVVLALLEHGADVSATDQTGSTAHNWATSRGLILLAQLLKKAEAKTTAPLKAEYKTAPPAPLVVHPITQQDEADAVLDLDDEIVTRELKPRPPATRVPQFSAVEPAAKRTAPPPEPTPRPLVLPRAAEPIISAPPTEKSPPTAMPVMSESVRERLPVRSNAAAGFSPKLFRAAFARFKAQVTMRQLAAAFIIGIVAGSILAYAIASQGSLTEAAPSSVESASPTENSVPAQLPPATSAGTKELKTTPRKTREVVSDERSPSAAQPQTQNSSTTKPGTQKRSDNSSTIEPAASAKPTRATSEKRSTTTQRATSPPPPAAPEVRQLALPPMQTVKEPVRETREAVTTPRKVTAPAATRTERSNAPPAAQPTASPAKKVIRWP